MIAIRTLGLRRRGASQTTPEPAAGSVASPVAPSAAGGLAVAIAPNDPLFAYLQSATGVVDVTRLELEFPALEQARAQGVRVIVPLVAQGELVGAMYLGPRLSDQEYSTDDLRLLTTLATHAAPAMRVAQLIREQALELQLRERLEQEMRVATLIQQQFLPRELPDLPGWQIAAYYRPARAVGGDFYDIIALPDGRIGLVVGDVTDKGVPAALLMARTQSVLRGEAPRSTSPGEVLARTNAVLLPEMPPRMFVTCLYIILDPATGDVVLANAGHNLPSIRTEDGVVELRATGLPLGLLPDMTYEERSGRIEPGQHILLYSDGLVEAHDPGGQMFGFPRLHELLRDDRSGHELLDGLLEDLHSFTGPGWDQEDDITLLTIARTTVPELHQGPTSPTTGPETAAGGLASTDASLTSLPSLEPPTQLLHLVLPGAQGNERDAMDAVAGAVADLGLSERALERLKTAVSEAAMNAIEYGSQGDPAVPVEIDVLLDERDVVVRISDRALSGPLTESEEPDIEAKLAGTQKPRGWGLFLIRHMVDEMDVTPGPDGQVVTLILHREGASDAGNPVSR